MTDPLCAWIGCEEPRGGGRGLGVYCPTHQEVRKLELAAARGPAVAEANRLRGQTAPVRDSERGPHERRALGLSLIGRELDQAEAVLEVSNGDVDEARRTWKRALSALIRAEVA